MADLDFGVGDVVRLRLAKREVEGTILESSDSSIYLLKLSSGYNIGILKENVLGGRALKKFKSEEKKLHVPEKKGLKKIGLIVTGGTIANKLDPRTGAVAPLTDVSEFARFYPELFKVADVKIEVPFMIASESMDFSHWTKIAEIAEKMLNDSEIEGVIITHGTDTLHYTSAALSFFLRDLNKPVVLTYSQRSIDRASSDANLNLQCAAQMALSDCAEVMLVGHATTNDDYCYAMPGTKVKKMHSSTRDAFKVVNDSPIAKVFPDKIEFLRGYNKRNSGKVALDTNFTDKVALVKFYPGQDPSILDYYALHSKGIVIEGTGLGHVASSDSRNPWFAKLKKLIREGFVVCVASQCVFGRVDPYVYTNLRDLADTGVIFLEDMLSETAMVKLGWVLGHHGWKGKVRERMLENVAGEFNSQLRLNDNSS